MKKNYFFHFKTFQYPKDYNMTSTYLRHQSQSQKSFTFKTFLVAINPSGPFMLSKKYREYIETLDLDESAKRQIRIGKGNPYDVYSRSDEHLINAIQTLGVENASKKGYEIRLVELPGVFRYFYDIIPDEDDTTGEKIRINLNSNIEKDMLEQFMDCFRESFCMDTYGLPDDTLSIVVDQDHNDY